MAKTRRQASRRYSTRARRRSGNSGAHATRVLAILVFLGILVYCALAMGVGTWIAERFITPRQGQAQEGPAHEDGGGSPTDLPARTSAPQITETISFPEMNVYAISAGTSDTLDEAQAVAQGYMARGGAGFVRKDNGYHVLISAYGDQTACQNVSEKLLTSQNIESTVYPIAVPAINLKLTASAPRIDGIRDAFAIWQQSVAMLDTLWQQVDSAVVSNTQAMETLRTQRDRLEDVRATAFEGTFIEGEATALDGLNSVLTKTCTYISTITDNPPEKTMAVSAKIKYTYLASLTEYETYVKSLQD